MSLVSGNLGRQSGQDIQVGVLEAFGQDILDVMRPELMKDDFFPAESFFKSMPRGMTDYSKIIQDWAGQAGWRAQGSNVVPQVSNILDKTSTPAFTGGVSNALDYKDIAQGNILASRGFSTDPIIRTGQVSLMATNYFKERLLFFGDNIEGAAGAFYPGMLNHPIIPQATVALGGTGFTPWNTKTPDEIIFDFNTAFATLQTSTNTVMLTSDVYLPTAQYNLIAGTKAGTRANDEVILQFVSDQNGTFGQTGRKINIHLLRYLTGAGAGGTDRMIVMDRKPDYFMIAEPLDWNLYDVQKVGFQFNYFGEFEIGPVHFPFPTFAQYWDGI
jgi:hypothetical protein